MEKSRAIELLKLAVPIKALTHQEFSDFVEAVNMGMDALEQPTSPDTIDRKAALDALRRCQTYLYDARDPELKIELSSAEAAINNLPTIQPEKAQLSQEGTTSDLISRQQAIDVLSLGKEMLSRVLDDIDVVGTVREKYSWGLGLIESYINDINELPSAQPEPQWIPVESKMPEDMQFVLLTVRRLKNGYNHEPFISVGYIGWNHQHWWCAHDGDCEISKVEVLAWMPLPKPFEGGTK